MILTFIILAVTILLFIAGKLPADLVALASLLALFLAGILTVDQALSGFGNSTVIMIAALFIVGEGLSRTGVTAWLGQQLLGLAGKSSLRLLVVLMAGTALLSGFISNTGTVATLMPAVIAAAWRIGSLPSMFLMPLAFAANTGGLLTLTGTAPNIVVGETLLASGFAPFGYFEYGLIGLPLLMVGIGYMAAAGRHLLPARKSGERPDDLIHSLDLLAEDYTLEANLFQLRVRRGSGLIGLSLEKARLGRDYKVMVLRVDQAHGGSFNYTGVFERQRQRMQERLEELSESEPPIPGADTIIQADDVLLVKGSREAVQQIQLRFNVGVVPVETDGGELAGTLLSQEVGIAEVVIAPRSAYIGRAVSSGQFAEKYNVQVVGIRRGDKEVPVTSELLLGDALLVRGKWGDIELMQGERRNFVVVGQPEALARQIVELSPRAIIAGLALVGMIALMVSGLVPVAIAALLAAVVMVLGGCLSMPQAYRAISWQSIILIAAMIPMSIALQETGGAEFLANGLVNTLGSAGPTLLMGGVFLLTAAFSQVINNTATTILVAPIVLQATLDLNYSPYPMLMIVAVSASTAFLTPIGTTTNLMVFSPGGYQFTDYVKVGLPLVLLYLIVSLVLVPLIWPI